MQFNNETCIYCLGNPSTPTGDHIFARKFFLTHRRANLPKAPCCKACGDEKSKLEAYLMGVLPFGGRHPDAHSNLASMVPRRLAKNKRLHHSLYGGRSRIWMREASGVLVRTLTVPIDGQKLEELFNYIVKGLLWHHWKVTLGADCFVEARLATLAEQRHYSRLLHQRASNRVNENLGNGTFTYVSAQGTDNPQISVWEFSTYGGAGISGGRRPNEVISKIYAITGPLRAREQAERRLRTGAYIIHP